MKTAFVLFSLLCLCCLVSSSTLGASFTLPGNASLYDWPGSTITAEPLCPALATLTYECPPEKTLKDFTLPEIQAEIWGRGYNAVEKFSFTVKQSLKSSFQYGVLKAKENYGRALRSTLKWIVLLWSYVIWALSCTAWYLLKNYTIEILMLSSLFAFTTFLVKLAVWIFGGWLTSLVNGLFALTKRILKTLSSRKSYVCERSVKGFLTFTIKQSPPRNCILQIQHADGSHAGYATCVTLFDGTNGLLTAQHVVDDFYEGDPKKTLKVVSTRNGNKIPLDEFRVTYTSEKRDQLLMHGPPNWEGVLACKAVHMIPASSVAKSKATFFALSDGEWHSSNAELVGTSKCGKFISVLSDTKSGHSGTPYFNGKSVLGVHIGSPKEFESENVNYMSPIPRFPGLTSPNYIFETTALAGKFFSQEEVEELMEDFSLQEIYSIATARGKYIKYEACPDEETFHDVLTESSPMQGEGRAAPTAGTTGNASTHERSAGNGKSPRAAPSTPREPSVKTAPQATYIAPQKRNMTNGRDAGAKLQATTATTDQISEIKKALIDKMDLKSIERQVVETLSSMAMKKPRSRGRRRSKNKQNNLDASSKPSTTGKEPQKSAPVSSKSVSSPSFTSLNKKDARIGARSSPASTQNWRRKPEASGGPSSGQRRN
uniref:p1 n=1 Tax=Beet mild yellowing virus TaxID=156690 RepID=Q45GB8_9VIRU|nr:P1 [Beet mild yellowing virus]QYA72326.1 P1 protein [Beet mild yellowing virus]